MSAYFTEKRINNLPGLHTLDHPSMKGQKADYENSVYVVFRQFVLPLIPGPTILVSKRYHAWNGRPGRPSKDINTLTGLRILQEMKDWTVKQALRALKCGTYAKCSLGLPDHAPDGAVRISEKTYYTFRKRFLEAGGPETACLQMTCAFLRAFKVDTSSVRIDSTHVCSNIKTLSGGGLSGRPSHSS
ncbi:MAG: hypothetical protein LBG06_12265 [Deltaproteobacteria bacterium]|jgi:hypothetical protein|nr:hypothetical protein [Deltaproteobacteria bacterium]